MKRRILLWACAFLCAASVAPVSFASYAKAEQVSDQGQARKDRRAGNVRSLREIEQSVLPQMSGMQYLGPEYDAAAMAYRLKFIHNGKVFFVDVDARSGRIIGRTR